MMRENPLFQSASRKPLSRREFVADAVAVAAALSAPTLAAATPNQLQAAEGAAAAKKIKLGVVGCGSRGTWISNLFLKHGGYTIHAVADYFENVAQRAGETFAVDKARRFSGLSGYKRLLQSGVDAVAIEDVPYFYPSQAKAAVEAGLHVYMAKPVAVDAPGTLSIGESGKLATRKKLCFLVDYQLPSDPAMIEIARRVRAGGLGALAHVASFGFAWHAWPDPPLEKTIESRLQNEIWLSDTVLSGDTIVSYDIHIIDGILAVIGKPPVAASGCSRTCRPKPNGDRTDAAGVVYERDDGLIWTHVTQSIDNNSDPTSLSASIFGMKATAHIQYGGKVYVRGGDEHYVGAIGSVFDEGVARNIAAFHANICAGRFDNPTVQRRSTAR